MVVSECYWPRAFLHLCLRPGLDAAGHRATRSMVLRALRDITPGVVLTDDGGVSVDITHSQPRFGVPERIVERVQARLPRTARLTCHTGVAGERWTARYAAGLASAGGVVVIPPWESRARLHDAPAARLQPHASPLTHLLSVPGARTCGEVARLPAAALVRRYGAEGRRLWMLCQGRAMDEPTEVIMPPYLVSCAKVLPPRTIRRRTIEAYVRALCARLARRLQRLDVTADRITISLRGAPAAAPRAELSVAEVQDDRPRLRAWVRDFVDRHSHGVAVTHVHVSATGLRHVGGQLDLFGAAPTGVRQTAGNRDAGRATGILVNRGRLQIL